MRWGLCVHVHDVSFESRESSEALLATCRSMEMPAAVLRALRSSGVGMLHAGPKSGEWRRRDSRGSCSPRFLWVTGGTDRGGWTPTPGTALAGLTAVPGKPRRVPAPGSTGQSELPLPPLCHGSPQAGRLKRDRGSQHDREELPQVVDEARCWRDSFRGWGGVGWLWSDRDSVALVPLKASGSATASLLLTQ